MKNGKWRMENGMCRKMKDSGVEWLGEVPEGWNLIPARNLFIEVKDKNVSGSETRQFSFRYGQIVDKEKSGRSDVTTEETITAYRIVTPDTIMINGLNLNYDFISQRVAIVKERGIITSAYLAVFPRKKLIDPAFAVYLFKGYDSKQVFHGHGSGIRKTLNFSDFKDIVTVCPPLPEQRKIAAYLDRTCAKIDEIVAGTKQTIEEYKAWKASLIFEAVTGKCRIENGKCRMGGQKMRDSGIPWLGEVPEGWNTLRLRFLCDITTGDSDTQDASPEGKYPFYVRSPIIERSNHFTFEGEGVLMAGDGAGAGRIFHEARGKYAVHQRVYIMYNFRKIIMRLFKYYISVSFPHVMDGGSAQSTVPSVRLPMLQNLLCVVPPHLDQLSIVEYLDKRCGIINRVIAEKEALIADLEAYRKSLIFEVVTGKMAMA